MCQVFSPFSEQRQLRPISKRRGPEPDTDEETDAGANWQSEQVHVLRLMELIDQPLSSAIVAE